MAQPPDAWAQRTQPNPVSFEMTAAVLGGAALVSRFGLIAYRVGLVVLTPFLLVAAVRLNVLFEV